MKSVSYTSSCYLSCVQCAGEIIICVDEDLTLSEKPFIEGIAASVQCQTDSCGRTNYVYAFTYEESQLLDPTTDLESSDISGVVCKGCLTEYIENQFVTDTGWTTMAGTAVKNNGAINADTITATDGNIQALAKAVKALMDALIGHKLIGT